MRFGLHHEYPFPNTGLKKVPLVEYISRPKGQDADLLHAVRFLGLHATLYLWYRNENYMDSLYELYPGVLCDSIPEDVDWTSGMSFVDYLCEHSGAVTAGNSEEVCVDVERHFYEKYSPTELSLDIDVVWATQPRGRNHVKTYYAAYGNQASLDYEYGHLCLLVKVGAYGSRGTTSQSDTVGVGAAKDAPGS